MQANFPQLPPTPIRTTAIGLDQEVSFARIEIASQFQPPRPDCGDGKFGGIVGGAHDNIALVRANIIDTIRDGFALSRVQKIIHIDLTSLFPPLLPGLLKVADQLTFFGIDTDDRPLAVQVSLTPAPNVAKLLVPMGRLLARYSFVVDPQRIILGLQQATNRRQTDGILRRQSLLDFAQRLVRPFQTRDWITSRFLCHQGFQSDYYIGSFFSVRGRPPPLTLIRSLKSLLAISR